MFVATMILLYAPDTPTGMWKDRHLNQIRLDIPAGTPTPAGRIVDTARYGLDDVIQCANASTQDSAALERDDFSEEGSTIRRGHALLDGEDVKAAEASLIKKPRPVDLLKVACSPPVLTQMACYFVTFGSELSINGVLSSLYMEASGSQAWSQRHAGSRAAIYGLLNIAARPLGGLIADQIYPRLGVEGKKYWMIFCKII